MASRFLPRLRLHRATAMDFPLHLRPESEILLAALVYPRIADPCFPLCRAMGKFAVLGVDLCRAMGMDFRLLATADFFAARSWPVVDSICPGSLYSFRIGFAIAPAGSVVAAAPDFDLCLNCSAIVIAAAGPDSVRRRFVFDLVSFAAA